MKLKTIIKNNDISILSLTNMIAFLLVILSNVFLAIQREVGVLLIDDNIKYAIVAIVIVFFAIQEFIQKKLFNKIFLKEFILITTTVIVFAILTLYYCVTNNGIFESRTVKELIFILLPALFTFFSIRIFDFREISIIMKIYFWVIIILYIWEIQGFLIKDLGMHSISLSASYSPFESSLIAMPAYTLFCYYTYFKNGNLKYYIGSIILVMMTFKRPLMATAILVMILDNSIQFKIYVKRIWKVVLELFFILMTVLYTWVLSGKIGNFSGEMLNKFTTNRFWLLNLVLNAAGERKGYGSTTIILGQIFSKPEGRYLEMDLVKILIEIGLIALIIFTISYFSLCQDNLLLLLIMSSIFMNLLVSHSLTDPFIWCCIMLFFATVNYKKEEIEEYFKKNPDRIQRLKIESIFKKIQNLFKKTGR